MHRLLPAVSAALVLAGAAASSAAAAGPAPRRLTAGQPLPAAERGYVQTLTGQARTVPSGWTILAWDFALPAGTSADLDLACPAGMALADLESGVPGQDLPAGLTWSPDDFVPFYGVNASTLTVTAAAGSTPTVQLTAACLPAVKARTTVLHGRAPVTIPGSENGVGLRKGTAIPRTWRLYKSVIRRVGADGAVARIAGACPGDTQHNLHAVSRPGRGGMTLPSNGFALRPSAALAQGPVTVYTLCSSLDE